MSATIGTTIRRLRRQQDITQEQLAEYLSVSPQAVSQWERNISAPDISLIIPIANVFGVTIDELFDRSAANEKAEIEAYFLEGIRLLNLGEIDKHLALWREASSKYPKNYDCMAQLAHAICNTLWTKLPAEERDSRAKEVVDICERILDGCTENGPRESAIQLLVYTYGSDRYSFADEKKAYEYANMAGSLITSREVMLQDIYATKEGLKASAAQKHSNNLLFTDLLTQNIYGTGRTAKEKILSCNTALRIWDAIIYDDNYMFYHCRVADIYQHLAKVYASLGDREHTLDSLRHMFIHSGKYDSRPSGERNYTSIFVSLATDDSSKSTKDFAGTFTEQRKNSISGDSDFDFIRDDPEFVALMEG